MQIKQAEIAFEIEKMQAEAKLKSELMAEEFAYNQQLRDISENALQTRENEREKAKSDRITQQNNQQSKLINQRKNNLPPQEFSADDKPVPPMQKMQGGKPPIFESNEDSLDGFDLAEFSPR
jgi:hypothetical protein